MFQNTVHGVEVAAANVERVVAASADHKAAARPLVDGESVVPGTTAEVCNFKVRQLEEVRFRSCDMQ